MVNHPKLYLIILLGLTALSSLGVGWSWSNTLQVQENSLIETNNITPAKDLAVILDKKQQKPAKREVKGLYLTAYSAGNPKKMDEIIKLIDETELNAVVIDIKDYSGKVFYNSYLLWVEEFGAKENRLGDVKALIQKLHEHNIYVIARQTVFQDPLLASKKPEWAIKSKNGGLWSDNKGLNWVDPTRVEVWNYNIEIAREAIRLGFDEINFDYVRFPSDGSMSLVVYNTGDKPKYEIMRNFYSYLRTKLDKESAWISLDMFGYVMERNDDMGIGQRMVDAVDSADYICPMMYPSHYAKNSLGYTNPAEIPGLIIENGMKKGLSVFKDKRAEVRPWIQAFNLGAVYTDGPKIREQIDMVEKYSDAGWLLWNASNKYSSAGLKVE